MQKRRKEIVDAIQWNGSNQSDIKALAGQFAMFDYADTNHDGKTFDAVLKVKTSEKIVPAQIGDYVVRGQKGDFFISKKADFESLYEPV